MTTDILHSLSKTQREAVSYTDSHLLILAGAGSGKTRVLTHKVAWLITERITKPEYITAVTFTNKAAGEMRSRINALVNNRQASKQIRVSTFHSFGLQFLFRNSISAQKMLGLREGFAVFDRDDSRSLMKEVLDEMPTPSDEKSPAEMLEIISKDYVMWSPNSRTRFIDEDDRLDKEWAADVADEYRSRLRKLNVVDFDDLMILPMMMMEQSNDLRKKEQELIRWLLVDEYQDVNHAQALMLRRYLVGPNTIINAVGDPDQSIYGWRGADITVILNFTHEYPNAQTIRLEQNYRSTKMILSGANTLIRHNLQRLEKNLFTANDTGDKITTVITADDYQEADYLAREIGRLRDVKAYRYSDIAILYRQNSMSRLLEKTFLRENIPCRIIRGVSFYDRMEVKDVLAIMKLALNPRDTVSIERAARIKTLLEGMGAKTLESWSDFLASQPAGTLDNPLHFWESVAMGEWRPSTKKARESMQKFAAHMCELLELADDGIRGVVDYVIGTMGYAGHLHQLDPESYADRIDNVLELKSIVPDGDLREALAEAALFTDADTSEDDADSVGLMTLHASKGLEFPVVFMIGMEQDLFPRIPAELMAYLGGRDSRIYDAEAEENRRKAEEELEEERRLCYVGMTRAEERLYMTAAKMRNLYGGVVQHEPSIFLDEIPDSVKKTDDRSARASFYDRNRRGGNYGGYGYNRRNRLW